MKRYDYFRANALCATGRNFRHARRYLSGIQKKRPGFPLKDCGNDDFEAVICDFMVILQYGFNRKIYSAFALIIIYIDEYNFDLLC